MSSKKAALIIIDMQEDFCPPNGSLAVQGARDIIPTINTLLTLPFVLKLATKDHHPPDHTSFASNHPGAQPFTSFTTIVNPANPAETYETRLWPDHCVVGTRGNELVSALALDRVDKVVHKGTDPRVEMYSAFRSPLRDPPLASAVSEIADDLRTAEVTDVVVVGVAGDYCVMSSAVDSAEEGEGRWKTWVVQDAVRCVDPGDGWSEARKRMEEKGVQVVGLEWVQNYFA